MLKPMRVTVEYKIYVTKVVVAEDNEATSDRGYDTQRWRIEREVDKIVKPAIKKLNRSLDGRYSFNWELESTIERL